jgi:hypothetical protein
MAVPTRAIRRPTAPTIRRAVLIVVMRMLPPAASMSLRQLMTVFPVLPDAKTRQLAAIGSHGPKLASQKRSIFKQ